MSKKKLNRKQQTKNLGDVTIDDFANSTTSKNRLKKSQNNVTTIIKQLETVKAWDETEDSEDFDLVQEENEDGVISIVLKRSSRRRNKSLQEYFKDTDSGYSYPIDIWFLISEYIAPEDIGIFAGICRASHDVIHSAKFWFSLYKRFYQSVSTLPERLQPESLVRRYGIRTAVIRSLYHMYPPFVNKLKAITTFEQHPDQLKKGVCTVTWYEKQKSTFIYYFKFKYGCDNRLTRINPENNQPDLLETLDDVCANQEENCRILQVCCLHYIAFPPVLGLSLVSVSLSLSQGLRHHRLLMGFGSGILTCSKKDVNNAEITLVVLDPVVNLKVLDWWHPLYPHDYNIEYLLNDEEK